MKHPVYRNLTLRDTLFGMDLADLIIMACVVNIVFRLHRTDLATGKILNIVIVAAVYLILVFVKRQFPKGYLKNLTTFLFKRRRFVADRDSICSLNEVMCEKE